MRSGLWQAGDASTKIPTAGEFLQEQAPEFAAASYDEGYLQYANLVGVQSWWAALPS